eukprot:2356286-Alexandrium_andersonii.AAC.1
MAQLLSSTNEKLHARVALQKQPVGSNPVCEIAEPNEALLRALDKHVCTEILSTGSVALHTRYLNVQYGVVRPLYAEAERARTSHIQASRLLDSRIAAIVNSAVAELVNF